MPTQATDQQSVKRRVLSMWQPFASLLVAGIKTVESRGTDTKFRGEFFVHATQAIPRAKVYEAYYESDPLFRAFVNEFLQIDRKTKLTWNDFRKSFTTGALIGRADLVDTMPSHVLQNSWQQARRLDDLDRELSLGDHYGADRFAWLCDDPITFQEPTLVKGCQTLFWSLPEEFVINP